MKMNNNVSCRILTKIAKEMIRLLTLAETRRIYGRKKYGQYFWCNQYVMNNQEEEVKFSEPLRIIMLDLSIGGIGALLEKRFEPETILALNLSLENPDDAVMAKVVYCEPLGEMYRIGMEFLDLSEGAIAYIHSLSEK